MTKYLAFMGIGINIKKSSVLGKSIPKASNIPKIAPEAPMVGIFTVSVITLLKSSSPGCVY